ncbi:MAG TPA: antitoxin VbhA family protein [Candidatus Gemmiger avicola]|uniref:Antitoxin VbhA family protein n=1 Tax=Candidatus Gemmiger avicola TaxID=2838605 RepID=A0A9D2S3M2_9FIRM|nr:antitoxin VbhA family protein [Candidatus Gemmiger avicola]
MGSISREQALKNALASSRMEGFPVTRQTEQDCRRLLNGTVTPQQMAAEILARRARQKE